MIKKCNTCNTEKDLIFFNKKSSSKDGYNNECKECRKTKRGLKKDSISESNKKYRENNKDYFKNYYKENKDTITDYKEIYRKENKDRLYLYRTKYREGNKDKLNEYLRNYREENKDKFKEYYINSRETTLKYREENKDKIKSRLNNYFKERKKTDDLFRLSCTIRSLISTSLKGYKKNTKTQQILGSSFEEFKLYLESKFEDWMSWDNYGKYDGSYNCGWDIDHIIPLSSAMSIDDIILLNNFKNLQPLCSKINREIKANQLSWSISN
jgi:hypothetical protein